MARLALAGGKPLRTAAVPALARLRRARAHAPPRGARGPQLGGYPFPNAHGRALRRAFAAAHDARHAFAVANGTIAIEIALVAAGLRPGDEVIAPAYTFEASAAPVLRLGGVPVFVDVSPDTYCIDPAAAAAAITPRTRAILPVHLAMCMADMDALGALAERARPARRRGLRPRPRGEVEGEGRGVARRRRGLQPPDEQAPHRGRGRRRHDERRRDRRAGRELHELRPREPLRPLRPPPPRLQLPPDRVPGRGAPRPAREAARRRPRCRARLAGRLSRGLAAIPGLSLLRPDPRQTTQAFYHYVFKYDAAAFGGASRDRFVAALEAEGIPCDGLFYEPVYRSTLFDVDPAVFPALGGACRGRACAAASPRGRRSRSRSGSPTAFCSGPRGTSTRCSRRCARSRERSTSCARPSTLSCASSR